MFNATEYGLLIRNAIRHAKDVFTVKDITDFVCNVIGTEQNRSQINRMVRYYLKELKIKVKTKKGNIKYYSKGR